MQIRGLLGPLLPLIEPAYASNYFFYGLELKSGEVAVLLCRNTTVVEESFKDTVSVGFGHSLLAYLPNS